MAVCGRCRQVAPITGDAYCLACAAWESLGRELQAHWPAGGHRAIVSEILVAGSRQVRALRNLAAAQALQAGTLPSRGTAASEARVKEEPKEGERRELPRRKSSGSGAQKDQISTAQAKSKGRRAERREEESEESEEESEEETPDHQHRPLGGSERKPPPDPDRQPDRPRQKEDRGRSAREADHPCRKRERSRHRSSRPEERRRRHRAGRKHQRLSRLLKDPLKVVHRRLPDSFLEERVEDRGLAALLQ